MRGLDEEPHGVLHQVLFQIVASLQKNIPNLPAIIKFVPDLFAMALETPDLPSQNQFSPKVFKLSKCKTHNVCLAVSSYT